MRSSPRLLLLRTVLAAAVMLVALVPAVLAQDDADDNDKEYIESYTMRTYSMNSANQGADTIYIRIHRYSTQEERATYMNALSDGGTPALTKLFTDAEEIGFIRHPGGRQGLKYVWLWPKEDGTHKIIFATERALGWGEVNRGLRTTDQTLSVGMMELNRKGKGEGQLVPVAEASYDPKTMHMSIEHQGQQPLRLVGIKLKK
jgi:hypothetical protein